jgi:hypothetical protein
MNTPATASPTPAAPPPPAPRRRRTFASYFWWSLFGALVLIGLYTAFMLWWSYSEGERAGVLQKFSKRGWICKTYEGELAMYVVGGVAPQIWDFSVRDPQVAESLSRVVGQQVRLHYTEHPGVPTNCFGETGYFVDRYELINLPLPAAPANGAIVQPVAPGASTPAAPPAALPAPAPAAGAPAT